MKKIIVVAVVILLVIIIMQSGAKNTVNASAGDNTGNNNHTDNTGNSTTSSIHSTDNIDNVPVSGNRNYPAVVNASRTVTLYYTTWCPWCKVMRPVWENVKESLKNTGIIFAESVEDVPKTNVSGYPTVRMIDEYGHTSEYFGMYNYTDFRNWIISPITWRQ